MRAQQSSKALLFLFGFVGLSTTLLQACTPKLNGANLVLLSTTSNQLRLTPTSRVLTAGNQFAFGVQGGVEPFTYSVASGRGSIDSTGVYQAPSNVVLAQVGDAGEFVTVRVTDAIAATADASVTIVDALEISDMTLTMGAGLTHVFSATGGISPYAYSVSAGSGSIHSGNGTFTAPSTAGTSVVRVRDAEGNEAFCFVTTLAGFGGTTEDIDLPVNNTYLLAPAGGQSPYSFAFAAMPHYGNITSPTGTASAYVAPATIPGTNPVVITVTDALSQAITYRFNVVSAVQISPTSKYLAYGDSFTFAASNGVSPYIYSLGGATSSGSVSPVGVFTASSTSGTAIVNVTDSRGNVSSAVVNVFPPLQIAPASVDWQIGSGAITFSATGGDQSGAYTWTRTGTGTPASGSGATFAYTPSSSAGTTEVVTVHDVTGVNTSSSNVRIYSPLMVAPSMLLAQGNTRTITPTGGIAPFTFVLNSGTTSGGLSVSSGSSTVYTASGAVGSQTVTVTDSIGNTGTMTITVNAPLALTPTSGSITINGAGTSCPSAPCNVMSFNATDGVNTGYNFSATCGTITTGGLYTAPATVGGGSCTITVTDGHTPTPNSRTATVTIRPALALVVNDATPDLQQQVTLTASGGVQNYTISRISATPPSGTFTFAGGAATTATFKANNESGTATFRVTDSAGSVPFAEVTLNINSPPNITPSPTGPLTLSSGDAQIFTLTGGIPQFDAGTDYQITVTQGSLTLSGCTGTATICTSHTGFTVTAGTVASSTPGEIEITDGSTNATIAFVLNPDVAITPTTWTMPVGRSKTFSAVPGTGVPPYKYSISPANGTIDADSGLYTPSSAGGVTVTVRDRNGTGQTATSSVTVQAPMTIGAGDLTPAAAGSTLITATNGVGSRTFSISNYSGTCGSLTSTTVNPTTFNAASDGGSCDITVTDSYPDAPANTATLSIVVDVPTPAAPGGLSLSNITPTGARLTWNSVSFATTYYVQVNSAGWINAGLVNQYDFTSGLNANADSTFYVYAVNAQSESGASGSITERICSVDYYILTGSCTSCATGNFSTGGVVTSCNACANPIPNSTGITWTPPRGCGVTDFTCGGGYGKIPGNPNATKCSQCAAGSASAGSAACASCSVGTYANSAGQSTCSTCTNVPANATAVTAYAGTGGTSATCPVSSVTCNTDRVHSGTADNCSTACAAGTYAPAANNLYSCSGCTNVPVGASSINWTSSGGGSPTGCGITDVSCNADRVHAGTADNCSTVCGAGTYSTAGNNAFSCSGCTNVPSGAWAVNWSSSGGGSPTGCGISSVTCSAGYAVSGGTACAGCGNGTYQSSNGTTSTSCTSCGSVANGYYNSGGGRDDAGDCSLACNGGYQEFAGGCCPASGTPTGGTVSCDGGNGWAYVLHNGACGTYNDTCNCIPPAVYEYGVCAVPMCDPGEWLGASCIEDSCSPGVGRVQQCSPLGTAWLWDCRPGGC